MYVLFLRYTYIYRGSNNNRKWFFIINDFENTFFISVYHNIGLGYMGTIEHLKIVNVFVKLDNRKENIINGKIHLVYKD